MLKEDLQNFGSLCGFELMPFGQCFEVPNGSIQVIPSSGSQNSWHNTGHAEVQAGHDYITIVISSSSNEGLELRTCSSSTFVALKAMLLFAS